MDPVIVKPHHTVQLGKQGENNAVRVVFPFVKEWLEQWPDGYITLIHRRPTKTEFLPVSVLAVDRDAGEAVWTVTSGDNEYAGYGEAELQLVYEDDVKKSETFDTCVTESPTAGDTPPEPHEGWVTQVLQAAATAQEGAENATEAAQAAAEAQTGAENAREEAEEAQTAAENAKDAALTAMAAAETAQTAAEAAQTAAEEAAEEAAGYVSGLTDSLAPEYSQHSTYSAGALVWHEGKLYRCKSFIYHSWEWDPDDWEETSVAAEVEKAGEKVVRFEFEMEIDDGGYIVIPYPEGLLDDILAVLNDNGSVLVATYKATHDDVEQNGEAQLLTYADDKVVFVTSEKVPGIGKQCIITVEDDDVVARPAQGISAADVVYESTNVGAELTAQKDAIERLQNSKIDINQGVAHAGKILGIDDDGMVTPVEGGSGSTYTAGYGISISSDNVISVNLPDAESGEF